MTARKQPTVVMHFTHIDNLSTVVQHGLLSDSAAQSSGLLSTEVANLDIKDRRRRRPVPVGAGGVVADYAPFYFRAPSPMMSAIAHRSGVDYEGGTGRLVYLVSTLERLVSDGLEPVITDRNASLEIAKFREFELADLIDDGFVDWEVMAAQYWNDHPDGRELRMAECLVHQVVPWATFRAVVVRNDVVAAEVRGVLDALGSTTEVRVLPSWYL